MIDFHKLNLSHWSDAKQIESQERPDAPVETKILSSTWRFELPLSGTHMHKVAMLSKIQEEIAKEDLVWSKSIDAASDRIVWW